MSKIIITISTEDKAFDIYNDINIDSDAAIELCDLMGKLLNTKETISISGRAIKVERLSDND
jgi:hypothetical protein